MSIFQQVSLFFRQGSSDKIYNVEIVNTTDGFLVNFSYGRRCGSLKSGTKTAAPVDKEKAIKIFNQLVKSKWSKGYAEEEVSLQSTSFQAQTDKEHSNVSCQLLNLINQHEAEVLCNDHRFCIQEKFDGERRLIERKSKVIKGINRKGYYVPLTHNLEQSFLNIHANSFIVDGEDLGDEIQLFDILMLNGEDLRERPYQERYYLLCSLAIDDPQLQIIRSFTTSEDKLALLKKLDALGKEGVVFKRLDAPYTEGRPNSGGSQLKRKFYKECSVIVAEHNSGKRSVSMAINDHNNAIVPIGSVTIPPNKEIPPVGSIINVRYLYAFKQGSLYQPIYEYKRGDLDNSDCHIRQLKYKAA